MNEQSANSMVHKKFCSSKLGVLGFSIRKPNKKEIRKIVEAGLDPLDPDICIEENKADGVVLLAKEVYTGMSISYEILDIIKN